MQRSRYRHGDGPGKNNDGTPKVKPNRLSQNKTPACFFANFKNKYFGYADAFKVIVIAICLFLLYRYAYVVFKSLKVTVNVPFDGPLVKKIAI